MLKASSLVYAIFICLIISILTGSIVYLNSMHRELNTINEIENDLIDHCESCLNYALIEATFNTDKEINTTIDIFNNGYNCFVKTKKWGLLNIISTGAYFKKDTVSTSYFVGENRFLKNTALYLTDLNEKLNISGTTLIEGDVFLPKKGYGISNILGNQQINNPKIKGNITASSNSLPSIEIAQNFSTKNKITDLSSLSKTNTNSFNKQTIEIELSDNQILNNIALKGNYVLKSEGSVTITTNTKLEDVILYAQNVIINDNFIGTLQVYAENSIEIGNKVQLNYPSSILINNAINTDKSIYLGKESVVLGGIVLNEGNNGDIVNKIMIDEKATVVGDVYCDGIMELKGTINGSIYTNKLEHNTEYSRYSNLLLNANISSSVPADFIHFPYFKNTTESNFDIIKKIQ